MTVNFPVNCITEASRLSFCFRLDELLRIEHNLKGKQYQDGLITKTDWENYLKNTFEPKSRAIHEDININRAIAEKSTYWDTADIKTNII